MHNDVFDEIKEILNENGSISESTKTRLVFLALTDINAHLVERTSVSDELSALVMETNKGVLTNIKRIKKLEDSNIIMWVKANPKVAVAITLGGLIFYKAFFPIIHYGLSLAGVPLEVLSLIF